MPGPRRRPDGIGVMYDDITRAPRSLNEGAMMNCPQADSHGLEIRDKLSTDSAMLSTGLQLLYSYGFSNNTRD